MNSVRLKIILPQWFQVRCHLPEKEALKAQAVCARSYAYIQLMRADLGFRAHINDSTSIRFIIK